MAPEFRSLSRRGSRKAAIGIVFPLGISSKRVWFSAARIMNIGCKRSPLSNGRNYCGHNVEAEFPMDIGARQIPKGESCNRSFRNVELSASCPRRLLNMRPVFGYAAKVIAIVHQISIN